MSGKARRAIREAMQERGLVAEPFTAPEKINGHKTKIVAIKDQILKIQAHDPISFLIKVMNGDPIEEHFFDEKGKKVTTYFSPSVKERVNVAKFLTTKIMPTMHLVKAVSDGDEPPAKTGFEALVDEALQRSRRNSGLNTDHQLIEHNGGKNAT